MPDVPPGVPDPQAVFAVLDEHDVEYIVIGGIAALMHDSPYPTFDTDICPATSDGNLTRLAAALRTIRARVFTDDEPGGIAASFDARSLQNVEILNLVTDHGRLDIVLHPAGSSGYPDLRQDAVVVTVGGIEVLVASLADVIRTKEAAGRADPSLPVLRRLLEARPPPPRRRGRPRTR